jgi:hypothetical protein
MALFIDAGVQNVRGEVLNLRPLLPSNVVSIYRVLTQTSDVSKILIDSLFRAATSKPSDILDEPRCLYLRVEATHLFL